VAGRGGSTADAALAHAIGGASGASSTLGARHSGVAGPAAAGETAGVDGDRVACTTA